MALKFREYDVVLTFLEPLLGSQPQKEVAKEFLIAREGEKTNGHDPANPESTPPVTTRLAAIPEDEEETLPSELEKGTTGFHKKDGKPVLWNYQIRGFLKEVAMNFNGHMDVKNARSKCNNFCFVLTRMIPIEFEGEITYNDRPLRAMTAQGPRIALARSEQIPAGAKIRFRLRVFKDEIKEELLRDWFSYGEMQGLGQWRNASWGSFTYEMSAVK